MADPTKSFIEKVNLLVANIDNIGKSAFEVAVLNGYLGTEAEWLESLKGADGAIGASGSNGLDGADGISAYQVALNNGFVGTEAQWLASLKGADGVVGAAGSNGLDGSNGISAYQVALNNGFIGTEAQWLASLKGVKGDKGADGTMTFTDLTVEQKASLKGDKGDQGNIGSAGISAYQVALNNGFAGTEAQWLSSLHGADGANGSNGISAYQVALNNGFVGTEAQWLSSLHGADGANGSNGISAYQVALNNGFAGTEAQWLSSLHGADGASGTTTSLTKPFMGTPLFTKVSASSITIPIGTKVLVGSTLVDVTDTVTLSLNTNLDTGAKAAGTDYSVYALNTGNFIISANKTSPSGFNTTTSKKIGGFHYGVIPEAFTAINNITSADATKIAGINAYSFWDLKFRPICDPSGMVYALGRWYDIYLLNTDHHTYGTSAAGKTIAGGAATYGRNFPKIPLFYGGDGTTTYGTLTWFEAAEIGKAYSKDMISYNEFIGIAYGVLEATSAGASDTGITQHLANFTSKFGLCMATGCEWIWGKDLIGPAGAAWNTNTEGRGSIYNASLIAAMFGGYRDYTVESGSRASGWYVTVWHTHWSIGCRYACDHLELA